MGYVQMNLNIVTLVQETKNIYFLSLFITVQQSKIWTE